MRGAPAKRGLAWKLSANSHRFFLSWQHFSMAARLGQIWQQREHSLSAPLRLCWCPAAGRLELSLTRSVPAVPAACCRLHDPSSFKDSDTSKLVAALVHRLLQTYERETGGWVWTYVWKCVSVSVSHVHA